jgi:L-ascorbate metabolism protein UlaG (beta-lactamase superfamily)
MKIKIMIACILIILACLAFLLIAGCSSIGTKPGDTEMVSFQRFDNFDKEKKQFVNRDQSKVDKMWDRLSEHTDSKRSIFSLFFGGKDKVPNEKLPEVIPDFKEFLGGTNQLKAIWFGHSSFILNIEGKIVLVDPVFGDAGPIWFIGSRFQDSVVKPKDLPPVDYIVISHDHYDHLEMDTMKYYAEKNVKFVVPMGISSYLIGWGIKKENITERGWWEDAKFDGINFTAVPAQHYSGRRGLNGNHTLWSSWIIKTNKHNVYLSGDSGYDIHYKQIGEKYGPFDVAFLDNGQYDESWREIHLLPKESIQAYRDLNAKKYVPVHWGVFHLGFHTWFDPIETITRLARENNVNLVTPKIGQVIDLENGSPNEDWWNRLITKK